MATIGLDTSVVVRLLVGGPAGQARVARQRLERAHEAGDAVLVSDLVVGEAYYALHYHYGVPKPEARELLRRFLESGLIVPTPAALIRALAQSPGAGVLDRLIHARYDDLGATTITFDARQARLEGVVRLPAR